MEDGAERPISYASRSLTDAEKRYSQLDKEALAVIFGVNKFHQYLYGRPFTIYTDHKPLAKITVTDVLCLLAMMGSHSELVQLFNNSPSWM